MTSLSYLTDFYLSNVYTKLLVVGKHLADDKRLLDLVDTKYLSSMKMLTDLTYLPDLTIYEKLE